MKNKVHPIKESLRFYRDLKREIANKEALIDSKTNFTMLEQLIQRVNDNPNLKVIVQTRDGTTLTLSTYHPKQNTVYGQIDGTEYIR